MTEHVVSPCDCGGTKYAILTGGQHPEAGPHCSGCGQPVTTERVHEHTPELEPLRIDRRTLLAHIDAITEAVEGLPTWHCYSDNGVDQGEHIERDEALALLRGER